MLHLIKKIIYGKQKLKFVLKILVKKSKFRMIFPTRGSNYFIYCSFFFSLTRGKIPVSIKEIGKKKGIIRAALTRIPNAAGLILEAFAAMENLFLYAMIQPYKEKK